MIKTNKWVVNWMDRYDDWDWDETPSDWDEWDAWQECQQDEPDEAWEEEYYRSYREQFPEEFEEKSITEDVTSFVQDIVRTYLNPKRYTDEPITPRRPREPLPPLLQAARALESGMSYRHQNRSALFLKQAKLLEHYEDDYPRRCRVTLYYPTYEGLTDSELRSYFAFRTRLRRGEAPEGCSSFLFLYLYELINGIGVENPREGLEQLDALAEKYASNSPSLEFHWEQWRRDYLAYYDLPPELNHPTPEAELSRLDAAEDMTTEEIIEALKCLDGVSSWLRRSKCYAKYQAEFHRVLSDTIRGMSRHCSGKTRSFCDRYFGLMHTMPVQLFSAAIFTDPLKRKNVRYCLSPWYIYTKERGMWFVTRRHISDSGSRKMTELVKSVDNALRAQFDPKHPIQAPAQPKWINALIQESLQSLLAEQAARQREQEKLKIDYSALERIRADAAITREKLRVEEEEETEEDLPQEIPEPVPEATPAADAAPGCPLNASEYRLMQCLLYGGDTGWIQREGLMESILLDSINEKLYDIFQDTVIEDAEIVEDYIDELKEMITP